MLRLATLNGSMGSSSVRFLGVSFLFTLNVLADVSWHQLWVLLPAIVFTSGVLSVAVVAVLHLRLDGLVLQVLFALLVPLVLLVTTSTSWIARSTTNCSTCERGLLASRHHTPPLSNLLLQLLDVGSVLGSLEGGDDSLVALVIVEDVDEAGKDHEG